MTRTPRLQLAVVLPLLGVAACDDEEPNTDPAPIEDLGELEGVWAQRGYAVLLEIDGTEITELHATDVSCVRASTSTFSEALQSYDRIVGNHAEFSWYGQAHFTRYEFDRIDALPTTCQDAGTVVDPEANFEALWHLFSENYAYFETRGVDWQAMYDTHRASIGPDSTDEELFAVFEQMLTPLHDGHAWVFDGESLAFLSGSLGGLWSSWAEDYEGEPVTNPADPRRDFIVDTRRYVLEDVLGGEGHSALYDTMHWGWLDDGIGYLDVHEMGSPDAGELTIPDMLVQIDEAMAQMQRDLLGAEAIIVDIRFNQGGRDTMGYAIAGWFTDTDVLVSRKRATHLGGWTAEQEVWVRPRTDTPFTVPVQLLTSANSISAAETFTLAMSELPTVTRVGDTTYGAFSDSLVRVLPNGWLVSLSNEVYEAPDGGIYEAIGIPPELEVAPDPSLNFTENLQRTLDAAIAAL